jgi:hypothetical protein
MKKLSLLAATLLAVFSLVPAVVNAQDTTVPDATDVVETARSKAQEKRKNKETRIAEIKEEVAARKLAVKQSVCEKKEARLDALIPRVTKNATNIKGVIDKKYEQVQDFYETGQLTVSNYSELVEVVELSKANAEESLETLSEYEFDEVDCEANNLAEQLDLFRSAASDTKEDLKTYRKDLVSLISSMQSANSNANRTGGTESTDDSGEDETEDETETETEETENNE